jgi:hypothetical protein
MVVANEDKSSPEPSYVLEIIGQTSSGINIIRKFTGYNFGIPTYIRYPEYIEVTLCNT